MAKVLSNEEIKDVILKYVSDERKKQAILLNGEWGCGKTFFVNEKLIPGLEQKGIQVFSISLYGIAKIEQIQDIIYMKLMQKVIKDKTQKVGYFGDGLAKVISLCGKSGIRFIDNKFNMEGTVSEEIKAIFEKKKGTNKRLVLIFDDIERCQINIIELMGFLNNLCENNEYKIILVANENEINKVDDDISQTLKFSIALNSRLDIKEFVEKKEESDEINREELRKIVDYYFEGKTTYEKTKEKLIGLTIPYNIPLEEVFEDVIADCVKEDNVKKIIIENKEEIICLLRKEKHQNLRTLISACLAIEEIYVALDKGNISREKLFSEELKNIIRYIVYTAIQRAKGIDGYVWSKDIRYGCINDGIFSTNKFKIYGYAFIDEYWKTQCVDCEIALEDVQNRIDEKKLLKEKLMKDQEHKALALNSLYDWYLMPDEEVKELVDKMREELKGGEYYPQEYKPIISILMCINNPDFGLNADKEKESTGKIYDSTQTNMFVEMKKNEEQHQNHYYEEWEKFNIDEFIDDMVKDVENKKYKLTPQMLGVLSEDKQFAFEYMKFTEPLMKKIEEAEVDSIISDEKGIKLSDMSWDEQLEIYCRDNKSNFVNYGKFISLFDYEKIKDKFFTATALEIHYFSSALSSVYSFYNLSDIFSADYEVIKDLCEYISENKNKLNREKSRTKEMALVRLQTDLNKYVKLVKR